MENIVRLNEHQRLALCERLSRGGSVRICTGTGTWDGQTATWIKWTDTGGMWTAPYYGLDY